MRLPDQLREQLKKPLGILIPDSSATKENISKKISKGAFIITVGDATTEKIIKFGFNPSLQIVDALEKRVKRNLPEMRVKTNLSCTNPAGEITEESISVIQQALKMEPPIRIIVKGEEDLLVIPVSIYAPDNGLIFYGQPNEGLVMLSITEEIRNRTRSIMDLMN